MASIIDNDAAFPLSALAACVSEDTLEWLEEEDTKQASWLKIQKVMAALQQQEDESKKAGGGEAPAPAPSEAAPEAAVTCRVRYWTSSAENPDGFGCIDGQEEPTPIDFSSEEEQDEDHSKYRPVQVAYILSDKWQGFGNQVWAASRHMANLFVNQEKCQKLLEPLLAHRAPLPPFRHPLEGLTFCELGAGAAIPSSTAIYCGARVVSLDQAIPARIRCLAETAQRNYQKASKKPPNGRMIFQPQVRGYDWGNPVDDITQVLAGDQEDAVPLEGPKFDVVVAADCCFMPWFYDELIASIDMLLSDKGVCILTFSLHGNVSEKENWAILEVAAERGLEAEEVFPPQQLTPQNKDTPPRGAFVHTLRLVKKQSN